MHIMACCAFNKPIVKREGAFRGLLIRSLIGIIKVTGFTIPAGKKMFKLDTHRMVIGKISAQVCLAVQKNSSGVSAKSI